MPETKTIKDLNVNCLFFTEAASLVIVDPEILLPRVNDKIDWWCEDSFIKIDEVKNGHMALLSLDGDGDFEVRITDGELQPLERQYACYKTRAGIEVKSGRIFIGQGEAISAGGMDLNSAVLDSGEGKFVELENGLYDLEIYAVDILTALDDTEEDVASIVAIVKPRKNHFLPLKEGDDQLFSGGDYLFDSPKPRGMLQMGITDKVKVFLSSAHESGKILRHAYDSGWPNNYIEYVMVLEDMSQVNHGDKLIVKSSHVDEKKKIIYCTLIEKI